MLQGRDITNKWRVGNNESEHDMAERIRESGCVRSNKSIISPEKELDKKLYKLS